MIKTTEVRQIGKSNNSLYYFGLVLGIMSMLQTMWEPYLVFRTFLRYVAVIFLMLYFGGIYLKYYKKYAIPLSLLFVCFFISGVKSSNFYNLYILLLLTLGAKGVPFKRILKTTLIVNVIFILFHIWGSSLGIIPQNSDFELLDRFGAFDEGLRQDFGYGWPSQFSLHVSSSVLIYWVLKQKLNIVEIFLIITIAFGLLYYTGGRTSVVCIFIIVFIELVYKISGYDSCCYKRGNNLLWFFVIICIPLYVILSFLITFFYDSSSEMWFLANVISTGRLELNQKVLFDEGVPLLGQFFEMYGSGNDMAFGDHYNYVDNSYLQFYILVGSICTTILIFAYTFLCYKVFKNREDKLAIAIALCGFISIFTQFFFILPYTPYILGLYSNLQQDAKSL